MLFARNPIIRRNDDDDDDDDDGLRAWTKRGEGGGCKAWETRGTEAVSEDTSFHTLTITYTRAYK